MGRRHYANSAPTATLAAGIGATTTSFDVSSLAGWPSSVPYTALLDKGTASAEIVLVTAVAGATVTVTRNMDGAGAFTHPAGAEFDHVAVALDYDEANAHVNATGGVHGVLGVLVGTTDTQTLSNKTLSNPTIITPTVQRAQFTGSVTVPAVVAKAAASGKSLTAQDSTGAEVFSVDDDGDTVVNKTLTVKGAVTAPSLTATGFVSGQLRQLTYVSETERDAAITAPVVGMLTYLSTPKGPWPPGMYQYTSAGWVPVATGALLGNAAGTAEVSLAGPLSTMHPVSDAQVTITFPVARKVRVAVRVLAHADTTAYLLQLYAGWVTGTAVPAVVAGGQTNPATTARGAGGRATVPVSDTFGTGLSYDVPATLAAGTYTFYPAVRRLTGSGVDTVGNGELAVYDAGPA